MAFITFMTAMAFIAFMAFMTFIAFMASVLCGLRDMASPRVYSRPAGLRGSKQVEKRVGWLKKQSVIQTRGPSSVAELAPKMH